MIDNENTNEFTSTNDPIYSINEIYQNHHKNKNYVGTIKHYLQSWLGTFDIRYAQHILAQNCVIINNGIAAGEIYNRIPLLFQNVKALSLQIHFISQEGNDVMSYVTHQMENKITGFKGSLTAMRLYQFNDEGLVYQIQVVQDNDQYQKLFNTTDRKSVV